MGRGRIGHGLLVIFGFLCGVGGGTREEKRENVLSHDGIDGGGGTGVNSNRAATAAYRMIGPGVTNFMVLFDNQKFGNKTDTTRTNMGVQNVGLQTRG